jgi:hypothetical protein
MTAGDYGTGGDDHPYELDYEPDYCTECGYPYSECGCWEEEDEDED